VTHLDKAQRAFRSGDAGGVADSAFAGFTAQGLKRTRSAEGFGGFPARQRRAPVR
jgi:hypothetical protein